MAKLLLTSALLPAPASIALAAEVARAGPGVTGKGSQAGCKRERSRANRLAVLNRLTTGLEAELAKAPSILEDEVVREMMGTFIAGSIDDDVPFVSLDRWCWAEFYDAHKSLSKGNDSAAFQYATDWKVCLAATFPARINLAKPYFGCFVPMSLTTRSGK